MLTCIDLAFSTIRNLGFSLLPSSLLAIYGKGNGQLLDILAGSRRPDSGTVTFQGDPVWGNERYYHSVLELNAHGVFNYFETVEKAAIRLGDVDTPLIEAGLHYFGLTGYADKRIFRIPAHLRARIRLLPLILCPRSVWFLTDIEKNLDDEGLALLYTLISGRCNRSGIVLMATKKTGFISPMMTLDLMDYQSVID